MFEAIILLGSLLAVAIGLASALLVVWLGRSAPRRIRRAWRALAMLMAGTSTLYAYLALHYFHEHSQFEHDDIDILMPIVSLCGSLTMLSMILLTRDSLGDPLKVADLKKAAFTDILTGLPNRRSFEMAIDERIELARRRDQPLAVMLFDIDHFKRINDAHGHDWGDEALRLIGKALRRSKRESDLAFRFGGEEFTLIAPNTSIQQAVAAADRLRRHVADLRLLKEEQLVTLTISVGVAELRPDDDAASILQRADVALYSAKRAGRNRVCMENCAVVQILAAQGHAASRASTPLPTGS